MNNKTEITWEEIDADMKRLAENVNELGIEVENYQAEVERGLIGKETDKKVEIWWPINRSNR